MLQSCTVRLLTTCWLVELKGEAGGGWRLTLWSSRQRLEPQVVSDGSRGSGFCSPSLPLLLGEISLCRSTHLGSNLQLKWFIWFCASRDGRGYTRRVTASDGADDGDITNALVVCFWCSQQMTFWAKTFRKSCSLEILYLRCVKPTSRWSKLGHPAIM